MTERRYRAYMLTVLATVFCFNNVDRIAISLFLQDIKTDLRLSDTQLGLMTGIAFAAFYSVMGIPIARLADRGNRVRIMGVTTALWSVALVACGAARSFVQLLSIRVFVAVGEAGCTPVAHSLIADYFSRAERPRAVALFLLGGSFSVFVGFFAAGWLNALYGWRVAFALLGLPGIPLAALAWFTLREPRLAQAIQARDVEAICGHPLTAQPPNLWQALALMYRVRAFRHLLFGIGISFFFYNGISKWLPTYFIRSFGLSTAAVGVSFGAIVGAGTLVGTLLSGEWPARLAPGDERRQLTILALIFCCVFPVSAAIYLVNSSSLAFFVLGLHAVCLASTFGPLYSSVPLVVPGHVRAMAVALVYLFGNMVGLGLGPLTVGAISDALHPALGQESLRYALLLMTPGFLWVAWHLRCASRYVEVDIEVAARVDADKAMPAENGPHGLGRIETAGSNALPLTLRAR